MTKHFSPTRVYRLLGAVLLISTLVALTGCGASTPAPKKLETVKVAMLGPILPFITYYAAVSQNYFADEGYQIDLVLTGGSGTDVQALIAGDVDFAVTGMGNIMPAAEQGQGVIAIQNMFDSMAFDLLVRKEVADRLGLTENSPLPTKLQALRGRTIAVTKIGALGHMVTQLYLRRAGLVEGKDATVVAAGSIPAMVASFEKGETDAAILPPPNGQSLLRRGLATMLINNSAGEDPELVGATFEVVATRAALTQQQREKVLKITRAFTRANQWVANAKVEEIADLMATFLQGYERVDLVESAKIVKLGVRADGRLTERGVQTNEQILLDAGVIKKQLPWNTIATNDFIPATLETSR